MQHPVMRLRQEGKVEGHAGSKSKFSAARGDVCRTIFCKCGGFSYTDPVLLAKQLKKLWLYFDKILKKY